jgi:hypothetical protein
MCASGNYKKGDVPNEDVFIPTAKRPEQTNEQMLTELMKLTANQG